MNSDRQCRCLICAISGNVLPYNDPAAWVRVFTVFYRGFRHPGHFHPPAQEKRAGTQPQTQERAS
jgi:hypothetical protein